MLPSGPLFLRPLSALRVVFLGFGLTFASLPATAQTADVAVEVPADALQQLLSVCVDAQACTAAINALLATLQSLNPGVPVATLIGSIAAEVIASYNDGAVPSAVAANVLSSAATAATSNGATTLANSLAQAATTAASGAAVDAAAVAQGTASPG